LSLGLEVKYIYN